MLQAYDHARPAGSHTRSVAIEELRSLAVRALRRMYRPKDRLFGYEIERGPEGDILRGVSRRYTAMVLIGLAGEEEDVASEVLHGHSLQAVCHRLLADVHRVDNLGDVAVTLWAARVLDHRDVEKASRRLEQLNPCDERHPTVELSWALTALSLDQDGRAHASLTTQVARRLLSSFRAESGLFGHWPNGAKSSLLRGHVCCFADLVYPIQSLSHYHRATGHAEAIEVARRCASVMCQLQGPDGQWWWHFDVRTGQVVESYPVYAVHQNAMAPMALFALEDACGVSHSGAIERGLKWLMHSPELNGASLIDFDAGLIWRKVARREPRKLSRGVQAAASRIYRSFRMPGLDRLLPPGRIDYESRPYHMGWLLHAWPADRLSQVRRGRTT